jgi:Uma2 family endonuclease
MEGYTRSMAEPVRKMPADRKPETTPSEDPFRYGTRWRTIRLPNGETDIEEIPLTVEDLLNPQLGDHVTQSRQHVQWFLRLGYLLERYYESRDDVLVCADLQILWGIPGLENPSPDVAIVQGVRDKEADRPSFDVVQEGVGPSLIVELVSSKYEEVRENDYVKKVTIYQRAGVPEYFILDLPCPRTQDRLLITAYRLGANGRYQRIEPDADGRLLSETTGLRFGVESDGKTLSLVDVRTGESPLEPPEEKARAREAEARQAAEAEVARLRLELEQLKKH